MRTFSLAVYAQVQTQLIYLFSLIVPDSCITSKQIYDNLRFFNPFEQHMNKAPDGLRFNLSGACWIRRLWRLLLFYEQLPAVIVNGKHAARRKVACNDFARKQRFHM